MHRLIFTALIVLLTLTNLSGASVIKHSARTIEHSGPPKPTLLKRRTIAKKQGSFQVSERALKFSFERVIKLAKRENYQKFYDSTESSLWIKEQLRSRNGFWTVQSFCEELTKDIPTPPSSPGKLVQAFAALEPGFRFSSPPDVAIANLGHDSYRSSFRVSSPIWTSIPGLDHLRDLTMWDFCVALRQGLHHFSSTHQQHNGQHEDVGEITPVTAKSSPPRNDDKGEGRLKHTFPLMQQTEPGKGQDKCRKFSKTMHDCATECFKLSKWAPVDKYAAAIGSGITLATLCCGCPGTAMIVGGVSAGYGVVAGAERFLKAHAKEQIQYAQGEQQVEGLEAHTSSSNVVTNPPLQQAKEVKSQMSPPKQQIIRRTGENGQKWELKNK